jgi:hypothetical protein
MERTRTARCVVIKCFCIREKVRVVTNHIKQEIQGSSHIYLSRVNPDIAPWVNFGLPFENESIMFLK